MLGIALGLAALRTACVPVGSFREALAQVEPGMAMERVTGILGSPNTICIHPRVDHVVLESDAVDAVDLERRTRERWVYSERRPRPPIPRLEDPQCRAPIGATELGFDVDGRVVWIARDVGRREVEVESSR